MTNETTVSCEEFRDLITEYLEKALPPAITLEMERHGNACESCEEFQSQIQLTVEALGSLRRQKSPETLDEDLLNAFRRWSKSAKESYRLDSSVLLQKLLSEPPAKIKLSLAMLPRDEAKELGELAMLEAARMGVEEPDSALRLAQMAVEILDNLSFIENPLDKKRINDKLGKALAVLGNCQKICSDHLAAAESFRRANDVLELGTGETQHKAHMLQVRAQYLADRGQFQQALDDLDSAICAYRSENDKHGEGRTLIGKGRVLGISGFEEDAIPCLKKGLELIDKGRDLRLILVAKHNLVEYLFDCSLEEEAYSLLEETRQLHTRLSNRVDLVRFSWLEGKIALNLGDMRSAEKHLLRAKSYFVEHEMAYDVALVSLDLAMVYLKQARTVELKELAAEMVTIFSGLGIQRELIAALAFFNKAKEIEQAATMTLLQELIEVAEKARQRGALGSPLNMSN